MECRVLIIGSGPAGMSAANALKGMEGVCVLERLTDGVFGRYHSVCGEAVSERMCRLAGIDPESMVSDADAISISFPGGVDIRVPVRGHIIDRPGMLRRMRENCGAELVRRTAVSVREEDGGYVVSTTAGEIRCRYLIGADGAHSVVRRDVFGSEPAGMLPVVNTLSPGDGGSVLAFTVGGGFDGFYSWRFPSKPGTVSIGFPKGAEEPDGVVSRGARHLPFGGVPRAVSGNAMLVGDAAGLANALCYGGIGAAMLSGKKAADAVRRGRPETYGRWYGRSIYRDPRFMEAHEAFSAWTDGDIEDAMEPFRRGYSLLRGARAMLRRPSYAGVYMAVWMALRFGW